MMPLFLSEPQLLFFALLRPLGLCIMFPILGSKNLGGGMIRNALVLALSLPILPLFFDRQYINALEALRLAGICQELMVGILIGFVVALPFWALDSAGYIVDTIRGASMGSVLNPSLGEAASMMGILFVQLFIAFFFMYGGLNHVLDVLYQSYHIIPPGSGLQAGDRWLKLLIAQWQTAFTLCVNFILPAVIVMVLTDLGIGLINRSAQQLNVFFLAMPVKSVLALLMLIMSLPFACKLYFSHLDKLPQYLGLLLREMKP
ncbi:type III secretion system export apparatus subunit SctT [Enterobacteriaceae bacterium H20N1]|uniref:Type III secretion system export apparatus subunit SctT n=1 Tax=Dryocola boscaweniae TaxID=2925397 RepID=A0A9X2W4S6_9ENTR|nr:type III secretion system export apparatus subunit SctT [Dryocola boscaweniae]MCT4700531.1 type III secretion system export apparatus subunit SctT [Dryocola boscaweniae]MCT4717687.1 type III secretion system export apparatus subunit SctT [Dryocola boscaweniae]